MEKKINVFAFDPDNLPEEGESLYHFGGDEGNVLMEFVFSKDFDCPLQKGDKYVLHEDLAILLS